MDRQLHLAPFIIEDVFSLDECRLIIYAAGRGRYSDASLIGGLRRDNTRRTRIAWLEQDGDQAWVFERILAAVAKSNRKQFGFRLDEFSEQIQIASYDAATEGFFDWHIDVGGGPLAARRKLTTIIQLSESSDYEGGDLETNADGHITVASRTIGSGLIMPSFVLHRVTPVTRGQRYSLVVWAHGPPFV